MIRIALNPNITPREIIGYYAMDLVTGLIAAGLCSLIEPLGIIKGMLIEGSINSISTAVGTVTYNALSGNALTDNLAVNMATAFVSGMISGGIRGYKLAKFYHADILTGNLDKSLDYIMETEFGEYLLTEYGIGEANEYLVARNTNLPEGYSNSNGDIVIPDGRKANGFVEPGKTLKNDKILGSKVYISKNTIKGYFKGNTISKDIIHHEMFHLKDYYSGNYYKEANYLYHSGYNTSQIKNIMFNWSEKRAYFFNYLLNPDPYYLEMYYFHNTQYINYFYGSY